MPPILGLDVGRKFVGLAIARPPVNVAIPVSSLLRAGHEAEKAILDLIEREHVEKVVVGLPYDQAGNETAECENIRNFCRRLEKRTNAKFVFVDESYSTGDARSRLAEGRRRISEQKKRGALDAVAASVLLAAYLENEAKLEASH